jgi:8-oxo-dGTP pyrophosphatase MutT (NUDIX family)
MVRYDFASIIEKLQNSHPLNKEHPLFKKSAVLILLIPNNESYNIVLTKRSSKLRVHKGEISFAGGRFDPETDKNLEETALRETFEEIGINSTDIRILGRMDDIPTISSFIIRPFIGVIKDPSYFHPRPNPEEVEEVFQISLDFFLQLGPFQESPFNQGGSKYYVLSFIYTDPTNGKKFNVWGATAHILSAYLLQFHGLTVTSPFYKRPSFEELVEYMKLVKTQNETT